MPAGKPRTFSAPGMMKSDEGNDTLDTFIRQSEPLLSFSRNGDNPIQWIQLLQALDQQDLPGWPLLTPLKVQMQKCEKCNREFCSPINYRRHIRVHRRSLNVDKVSHKNRDLLGEFWDKLSLDEAKENVSFKDVTLEEVPGSSIIRALTSLIQKPGFCVLPPVYVRAGSAILDIIQGRFSRLPISSKELFSILDDASERTFLCAGTAESLQKYVFDGDAGKIGLEMKNVVACTSFLLEQKLVKSWVADKDAEALRCQKLLVEEEEASQKKQADLLERKRQKKLRQKEKAKDQSNGDKADLSITADIILEASPPSTETSSPSAPSDTNSNAFETSTDQVSSLLEPITLLSNEDADTQVQNLLSSEYQDLGTDQNLEPLKEQGNNRRQKWQIPRAQKSGRNGFRHTNQNIHTSKIEYSQNHGPNRDPRTAPVSGNKVWTKKPRTENSGEHVRTSVVRKEATNQTDQSTKVVRKEATNQTDQSTRVVRKEATNQTDQSTRVVRKEATNQTDQSTRVVRKEATNQTDQSTRVVRKEATNQTDQSTRVVRKEATNQTDQSSCEVMIGSISVTIKNDNYKAEHAKTEKLTKQDSAYGSNRSGAKFWRPVSRNEPRSQFAVQSGNQESTEEDVILVKDDDRMMANEGCVQSCAVDGYDMDDRNNPHSLLEEDLQKGAPFSIRSAKAFLSQRWKEAISGDHVKLVLSPEPESPGYPDDGDAQNAPHQVSEPPSDFHPRNVFGNAENRLVVVEALESPTTGNGNGRPKVRTKPEKGTVKIKYIPKQKTVI